MVFTPQIFENFRRSSADGLSIVFVIVWLLGDVFNILGAILQGVQPTMTVLAIYYTVADAVLLGQCFYYRGFTLSDDPSGPSPSPEDETAVEEENSPLLWRQSQPRRYRSRSSFSSFSGHVRHESPTMASVDSELPSRFLPQLSTIRAIFGNTIALLLTCVAGVVGWHVTLHRSSTINSPTTHTSPITFNLGGQIFGYLCAVLYIGSRIPQLLLNYRRKSTEGVSVLFFLFACVGNITYVFSVLAYEPSCVRIAGGGYWDTGCGDGEWRHGYARYMLANASWIAGSTVTLVLDLMIFGQFYVYHGNKV